MNITSNAPLRDPHEPVLPDGMKPSEVAHVEDRPVQVPLDEQLAEGLPSAADLDAVEAEKNIADGTGQAEKPQG
jgi:hypothetical protein